MQTRSCALLVVLAACGGDDGSSATADAPPSAPPMITVSGQATKRQSSPNATPAVGAIIAAYRNGDSNPVAMATADAQGNYTLTLTTNGVALDGYLKSSLSGFIDTYLYPPKALAEDYAMASINIIDQGTLDLLSNLLCGSQQDSAKGVVAMIVADSNRTPVAGAKVTAEPAAAKYCYNQGGTPNKNAMMTEADGIGYMLNIPAGSVTVGATMTGTTYASHKVEARAGAFTTTVVQP